MKKIPVFIFIIITLFFNISAKAEEDDFVLYFFWGEGCSHCENVKGFVDQLKNDHPELKIMTYEVMNNPENKDMFQEMAAELGEKAKGVPAFIYQDNIWFGDSEKNQLEIEKAVQLSLNGYSFNNKEDYRLNLPVIGEVNIRNTPLFLTTLLVSLVDGFNPCSLWVLTFLLNFIIYSGSRRKVLLVGITFLAVSALTYGFFIIGVFTVFSYLQNLYIIRLFIFIFVLIFALVNIKDYFFFNKGFSFTIPDRFKPDIARKLGQISRIESSNIKLILTTGIFSFAITLLELPCTAGFPFLWMNIIQDYNISRLLFFALLLLYLLIYFLDELFIVFLAYITLRIKKVGEEQGRRLKLISGIAMLFLALALIFKPALLNNISGLFYIIIFTVMLYLLITFFKRRTENKDLSI